MKTEFTPEEIERDKVIIKRFKILQQEEEEHKERLKEIRKEKKELTDEKLALIGFGN